MSGVNKVILVGNVGKDPDVRELSENKTVANFSIAISESWTARDGQRHESTEWHNVVAWNGLARIVDKYLRKGDHVYVEGKLKTTSWEEDGVKKYRVNILAEHIQIFGKKRDHAEETEDDYTHNVEP